MVFNCSGELIQRRLTKVMTDIIRDRLTIIPQT